MQYKDITATETTHKFCFGFPQDVQMMALTETLMHHMKQGLNERIKEIRKRNTEDVAEYWSFPNQLSVLR